MTLPEGFAWQAVHLNDRREPRVLALHGEGVVRLEDRVDDGSWFAMLDYHHGMGRKTPTRPCTSFEAGKRGAELWVVRHEDRLRREVAEKNAARPRPRWVSDAPKGG